MSIFVLSVFSTEANLHCFTEAYFDQQNIFDEFQSGGGFKINLCLIAHPEIALEYIIYILSLFD